MAERRRPYRKPAGALEDATPDDFAQLKSGSYLYTYGDERVELDIRGGPKRVHADFGMVGTSRIIVPETVEPLRAAFRARYGRMTVKRYLTDGNQVMKLLVSRGDEAEWIHRIAQFFLDPANFKLDPQAVAPGERLWELQRKRTDRVEPRQTDAWFRKMHGLRGQTDAGDSGTVGRVVEFRAGTGQTLMARSGARIGTAKGPDGPEAA